MMNYPGVGAAPERKTTFAGSVNTGKMPIRSKNLKERTHEKNYRHGAAG
jgi:hypothetical protein